MGDDSNIHAHSRLNISHGCLTGVGMMFVRCFDDLVLVSYGCDGSLMVFWMPCDFTLFPKRFLSREDFVSFGISIFLLDSVRSSSRVQ